ncbi:protein DEK-like [Montipora foliosa]|uniref:protein DEK-like n=1 Tax=Montipora foliosa TaxID=591990 RepID=UPI0035F12942
MEEEKHQDDNPSTPVTTQNPPKLKRKRIQKICTKCGKSMQNLSRHQKEVHGMSKLKRKLNDYYSGGKKTPKGTVKFCPLSPCKSKRTPIFQLHKHLQSNIHKLKVGSPSYVRALDKAPRISFKDLGSRMSEKRERRKRLTEKDEQRDEGTNSESSCSLGSTEKHGHRSTEHRHSSERHKRVLESYESDRFKGKKIKKTRQEYDSDDESEALAKKKKKKKKKKKTEKKQKLNRVYKLLDDENNSQKEEDKNREKCQEEKKSSDEEYDCLSERVWNKNKTGSNKVFYRSDDKGLKGLSSRIESMDDTLENYERDFTIEEDSAILDTVHKKENSITVISDSDESDPDYNPKEESNSDVSSESHSSESSTCMSEERDHLLTELVEIIGEDNCKGQSFLVSEEPWKKIVNNFIEEKVKQGSTFKTPTESENDLRRDFDNRDEESSEGEIFQEIFQGDASDNDDALDQEWVPSDSETNVQTPYENNPENKKEEFQENELLSEFYSRLVEVDGGYRNEKIASQYKSQVQSVIQRLRQTATATSDNGEVHH